MENWIDARIDELVVNGLFCDGDWVESKDQDPSGEVRLIQLADIGDGNFKDKSDRHLTKEKSVELGCTYLLKGDILVARLPDPLGRACLFPFNEEEKYVTVVDICIIRPNTLEISNKYLLYCINSPLIRNRIEEYKSGSTRKRISRKNFSKIDLPIAPLPEQRAIVAKIEQLFSELDNGIDNLKKAQEQLKVYRQAVLKKAFEGALTKAWRAQQRDLPTAEELLEQIKEEREAHYYQQVEAWKVELKDWESNGKEGKKPSKPKKGNELVLPKRKLTKVPQEWCSLTIDWFLSLGEKGMTTGPFGTLLKKSEHTTAGIPVLGIENIGEGVFRMPNKIFVSHEKAKELPSFEVNAGDVIISRSGTVGEICAVSQSIGKALISTNLIRVSLNEKVVYSSFFVYLFQGGNVRQQVKRLCAGSTRDFLNQTILNSIIFPFPHLTEQYQIVQEIESRLSVCDKVEETIKESLGKAEALRQSILKKAFEGKLLTEAELGACRKEPDWEPAEKLLERIKTEKGNAGKAKKKEVLA